MTANYTFKKRKAGFALDVPQAVVNRFISSEDPHARSIISKTLSNFLYTHCPKIVVVCVGTDLVTGDSFGPLVGTFLEQMGLNNVSIYGTLKHPVHALNLLKTIQIIEREHPFSFVIAVDASLGKKDNIGYINLVNQPLHPGAALQKKLPYIGNCAIKGIINEVGQSEFYTLQNTRLHLVWDLAQLTANSIADSIHSMS
ncbi:spore protease YyaC [Priestia megaterium]|nr:spore protease YyaC [Priestia megaterium]